MKEKTIDNKILEYLVNGNKINQWNSYELFQYTRLSATIFNLKARGYQIGDEWKIGANGKKYKNYWLVKKKQDLVKEPATKESEMELEQTALGFNIKLKDYEWPD